MEKVATVLGQPQGRAKAATAEPFAVVAQLAEQPPFKRTVGGSFALRRHRMKCPCCSKRMDRFVCSFCGTRIIRTGQKL